MSVDKNSLMSSRNLRDFCAMTLYTYTQIHEIMPLEACNVEHCLGTWGWTLGSFSLPLFPLRENGLLILNPVHIYFIRIVCICATFILNIWSNLVYYMPLHMVLCVSIVVEHWINKRENELFSTRHMWNNV